MTANCAQIAAIRRTAACRASAAWSPPRSATPGWSWTALARSSWGAAAYVLPRVDPAEVVRVLDEERIGYAALVPAILRMLLDVPDVARASLPATCG